MRSPVSISTFRRFAQYARPLILGIETSCDDTGIGIVSSDRQILGQCLLSQQATHNKLGGIIPTYANTLHAKNLPIALERALDDADLTVSDLDYIAVTTRPGLAICLREGAKLADELARNYAKPLITVHHMQAHALTIRLLRKEVNYPFLTYLMSGGHCLLVHVNSPTDFKILGSHVGVSPGELFDKVARRLRLRFLPGFAELSGGAAVEKLAKEGDPLRFKFYGNSNWSDRKTANVSFGALYVSMIARIEQREADENVRFGHISDLPDFCAAFQHSVFVSLARRLQVALEYLESTNEIEPSSTGDNESSTSAAGRPSRKESDDANYDGFTVVAPGITVNLISAQSTDTPDSKLNENYPKNDLSGSVDPTSRTKSLVLSGGVASNSYIREGLAWVAQKYGYRTFSPPPNLCTDNGVMVAWNAHELLSAGVTPVDIAHFDWELDCKPGVAVGPNISDVVELAVKNRTMMSIHKLDFARYFVRHWKGSLLE